MRVCGTVYVSCWLSCGHGLIEGVCEGVVLEGERGGPLSLQRVKVG